MNRNNIINLMTELELLINNDNTKNNVVDKDLSINNNGIRTIENSLSSNNLEMFRMFFYEEFVKVSDIIRNSQDYSSNFLKDLIENNTNLNGYVWRFDIQNNDPWISTYLDIITAMHKVYKEITTLLLFNKLNNEMLIFDLNYLDDSDCEDVYQDELNNEQQDKIEQLLKIANKINLYLHRLSYFKDFLKGKDYLDYVLKQDNQIYFVYRNVDNESVKLNLTLLFANWLTQL